MIYMYDILKDYVKIMLILRIHRLYIYTTYEEINPVRDPERMQCNFSWYLDHGWGRFANIHCWQMATP